jgi:hypothetical protein
VSPPIPPCRVAACEAPGATLAAMPLPPILRPVGVGLLLDVVLRLGAVSGAGLALLMGRFLLAGVLAAVALGITLRLWRARRLARPGTRPPPAPTR